MDRNRTIKYDRLIREKYVLTINVRIYIKDIHLLFSSKRYQKKFFHPLIIPIAVKNEIDPSINNPENLAGATGRKGNIYNDITKKNIPQAMAMIKKKVL